jgi:hypothetical protein
LPVVVLSSSLRIDWFAGNSTNPPEPEFTLALELRTPDGQTLRYEGLPGKAYYPKQALDEFQRFARGPRTGLGLTWAVRGRYASTMYRRRWNLQNDVSLVGALLLPVAFLGGGCLILLAVAGVGYMEALKRSPSMALSGPSGPPPSISS